MVLEIAVRCLGHVSGVAWVIGSRGGLHAILPPSKVVRCPMLPYYPHFFIVTHIFAFITPIFAAISLIFLVSPTFIPSLQECRLLATPLGLVKNTID